MPDYAFITTCIGVAGFIIAAITLGMKSREGSKEEAEFDATIGTKLDFISSDIKDIKADQRSFRSEINDVRRIAVLAQERAEAAHSRLDRSGIDDHVVDTNNK